MESFSTCYRNLKAKIFPYLNSFLHELLLSKSNEWLRFVYSINAIHGYSVIWVSSPPTIRSDISFPHSPGWGKSLSVKPFVDGFWVFGCWVGSSSSLGQQT